VIEIIIQNTGSDVGSVDVHPFHAHGAHYWDLGSGEGTYDWKENEKNIGGKQLAKRDTTMLYRYGEKAEKGMDAGWRAWRLRVTEPGVWMVHCHILQHMVMGNLSNDLLYVRPLLRHDLGMQTVWVMGNESEIMKVPIEHIQGYLIYGGSV
jgi:L-ascorbate oxidase